MSLIAIPPSAEGNGILRCRYRTVNWYKRIFLILIHNNRAVQLNSGNAESFTTRRLDDTAQLSLRHPSALGHGVSATPDARSQLSSNRPRASSLHLRYVSFAPLRARMTASVSVKTITGRPRNSHISPVSSYRDNRL
jgi:hypothetical protein